MLDKFSRPDDAHWIRRHDRQNNLQAIAPLQGGAASHAGAPRKRALDMSLDDLAQVRSPSTSWSPPRLPSMQYGGSQSQPHDGRGLVTVHPDDWKKIMGTNAVPGSVGEVLVTRLADGTHSISRGGLATSVPLGAAIYPGHDTPERQAEDRLFGLHKSRRVPAAKSFAMDSEEYLCKILAPVFVKRVGEVQLRSRARCHLLDSYLGQLEPVTNPLYKFSCGRYLDQVGEFYAGVLWFALQIPICPILGKWSRLVSFAYRCWLHQHLPYLDEGQIPAGFQASFRRRNMYVLDGNKWVVCPEVLRRR